ncbi:hypothetical protein FHS94_003880 [Sphingomonas aerophila]|uniref:Uncharacterized protein n=1 Tax=Sphingomonas aerophila TaxID=1344948 RepID=A0A7W9EXN6_9SPHN|nr:hypothetical protein [Sphingomonas aerophila]
MVNQNQIGSSRRLIGGRCNPRAGTCPFEILNPINPAQTIATMTPKVPANSIANY